ncbi:hypothetical protein HAX54_002149 [Datura stramonium]|uniref:MADS-box domain-containing protein n=1 Tax=Datura stramonium TaxID=4076 RepID=A0ABS8WUY9_DATST|nr:hypothetical protein [Datura stramonium]
MEFRVPEDSVEIIRDVIRVEELEHEASTANADLEERGGGDFFSGVIRTKVNLTYIENEAARKVTYNKRIKGFLKKAYELSILCNVEVVSVFYSSYNDEPVVFPNREVVTNTLTKFRALPALVQSKNMVTIEKYTKKMIEKKKKNLRKLKKENYIKELEIMMNKIMEGEAIPTDLHPNDFNNLMYVMNQHLTKIRELEKKRANEEGSTPNAFQPINGRMIHGGTNLEGPTEVAPVSMTPLVTPSMFSGGTNFERPRSPLFVPDVDPKWLVPTMAPSTILFPDLGDVPQQLFHREAPLETPPQMVPLVDPSRIPPFSLFSSQTFSSISQNLRRDPVMPPPLSTVSMTSLMPSPMMASPMSAPVFPPVTDPSVNISSISAPMSMNNYQNYSIDSPRNPTSSEWIDWNDDYVMALFDDSYLNNINIQDPSHNNF